MSFKRIAVLGAVAVGAMALVGSGYAAAQDNGSSTTLITSPAAGTTSQAYGGASTSQLSPAGVQALVASYSAGCGATTSGTTITVTVSGNQGTPTGTVTLTGHQGTQTPPLSGGQASFTYDSAVAGQTINFTYDGNGTYTSCSGSIAFPKATPTCTVTRPSSGKTVNITVSGSAGQATGTVTFPAKGGELASSPPLVSGTASRTYGPNPGPTTVTYGGDTHYNGCSGTSS